MEDGRQRLMKMFIVSWIVGVVFILIMPQLTLSCKVLVLQLFLTVFVLMIKNPYIGLIAIPLPLVSIINFLIKLNSIAEVYRVILTILTSITVLLIPGATVILIINRVRRTKISFLERILISYILSLFIAAIVSLFVKKAEYLAIVYLAFVIMFIMSLVPNIKRGNIRKRIKSIREFKTRTILHVILLLINTFMIIALIYPDEAFVATDTARLYAGALSYIHRDPIRSHYPSYLSHIAVIYQLSKEPSPFLLNTILTFWTFILPLSLYVLTRELYEEEHAFIATYLFLFGGGLGWLYILKLIGEGITWIKSPWYERHIEWVTNGDIGYELGAWLWLWYRPVTVGTMILIMLLYGLLNDRLDRHIRDIILVLSPALLMNYHPSELVLSLIILFAVSVEVELSKRNILMLSMSVIIGSALKVAYRASELRQTLIFSALIMLAIITIAILSKYIRKFKKIIAKNISRSYLASKLGGVMLTIAISSYVLAALECILNASALAVDLKYRPVPLYHYVMLLGLPGLLALFALVDKEFIKKHWRTNIIFIVIIILGVIFGKMLTYINESRIVYLLQSTVGSTYFERRIVASLIYPILCIFSSHTLIRLARKSMYEIDKRSYIRGSLRLIFISFLIIMSIMSTPYTVNWHFEVIKRDSLDARSAEALNNILAEGTLLDELAKSNIIALTPHSFVMAQYLPAIWKIGLNKRNIFMELRYPNLFLRLCSAYNTYYAFLYNNEEIEKEKISGFLKYLFDFSNPIRYEDYEIVLLPYMLPPSIISDIGLVFKEFNKDTLLTSSILSFLGINYTHIHYLDVNALSRCHWLVVPSNDLVKLTLNVLNSTNSSRHNIILLNLDGSYTVIQDILRKDSTIYLNTTYEGIKVNGIPYGRNANIGYPTSAINLTLEICGDDPKALVLLDENISGWTSKGIGKGYGRISIPHLTSSYNAISGNISLRIEVGKGSYYQWQIERSFNKVNTSGYDYLSLYWYGRNDHKEYVVRILTTSGSILYAFTDNWTGWRKVYLPLKLPNGRYIINGIVITREGVGNPTLSNVTKIEIKNSARCLNLAGSFLIDRIAFEHAPKIYIRYTLDDRLISGLKVYVAVDNNKLLLINNTRLTTCGNKAIKVKSFHINKDGFELELELSSSPRAKIEIYPYERVNITVGRRIYSIDTIASPRLFNNTNMPFVLKINDKGNNIFLINIYPLYVAYKGGSLGLNEFLSITNHIFKQIGIPYGEGAKPKPIYKSTRLVLKDIEAKGCIIIRPTDDDVIALSTNDTALVFIANEKGQLMIEALELSVIERCGFYVKMHLKNATIHTDGRLNIMISNNGSFRYTTLNKNEMSLGDCQMMLRGLRIEVNGDANLKRVYTFMNVSALYNAEGKDIRIKGYLRMVLRIFDTFMAGESLLIKGKIEGLEAYHSYEVDLRFLQHILPSSFIIAAIYMLISKKFAKRH